MGKGQEYTEKLFTKWGSEIEGVEQLVNLYFTLVSRNDGF